jgi:hypothetical protein
MTLRLMAPLLLVCALVAGCMHSSAPAVVAPRALDTPQLVENSPPRTLYRYIGRVQGVARSPDPVEAARTARDDLRWKAYVLGADLVRIDYVAAPPDGAHARRRVLIAGRAYKAIAHP